MVFHFPMEFHENINYCITREQRVSEIVRGARLDREGRGRISRGDSERIFDFADQLLEGILLVERVFGILAVVASPIRRRFDASGVARA